QLANPDRNLVAELFDALEFNTICDRVFTTFEQQLGSSEEPAPAEDIPTTRSIGDVAAWQTYMSDVDEPYSLFFNIKPPSTITRRKIRAPGDYGQIRSLGLATSIATAVIDIDTAPLELGQAIATFLADQQYTKVVYDLKTVLKALATAPSDSALPANPDVNTSIVGVEDDVLLSAYILQPDRRGYELADLVQTYLNTRLETAAPTSDQVQLYFVGLDDDNAELLAQYARSAWLVHRLNEAMGVELQRRGAVGLLHDLEIPLSVVLAKMELTGIGIDRQRLDNLLDGFTEEVAKAQQSAFA